MAVAFHPFKKETKYNPLILTADLSTFYVKLNVLPNKNSLKSKIFFPLQVSTKPRWKGKILGEKKFCHGANKNILFNV